MYEEFGEEKEYDQNGGLRLHQRRLEHICDTLKSVWSFVDLVFLKLRIWPKEHLSFLKWNVSVNTSQNTIKAVVRQTKS